MPTIENARRSTKKEAALRQINASIQHLFDSEYECAITLACAAEDQLVAPEQNHFFELLKAHRPSDFADEKAWATWLNETRDWLKHESKHLGDERVITEHEAFMFVLRAVNKFGWAYRQGSERMVEFYAWCDTRGYLPPRDQEAPKLSS